MYLHCKSGGSSKPKMRQLLVFVLLCQYISKILPFKLFIHPLPINPSYLNISALQIKPWNILPKRDGSWAKFVLKKLLWKNKLFFPLLSTRVFLCKQNYYNGTLLHYIRCTVYTEPSRNGMNLYFYDSFRRFLPPNGDCPWTQPRTPSCHWI